jgi:hypothetical protein
MVAANLSLFNSESVNIMATYKSEKLPLSEQQNLSCVLILGIHYLRRTYIILIAAAAAAAAATTTATNVM